MEFFFICLYKTGWLNKHNKYVALLKAKSNTSTVVIGDSIAAGLIRYRNVWGKKFNRDTRNCEIGGNKTQNVLRRYNNITLPQSLKYVLINCDTNNLDTDNPDEISDGLICMVLFFQKRMKHLHIAVNGRISCDTTNTKRRQKLIEVNQLSYTNVYFLKPDTDWTTLDGGLKKTFCYYKDNIHLLENGNKKLALSIKLKLDNIRINCHQITINRKVLPTIKAVDYQSVDYQRAITTLSKNRRSNSKRNIKLESLKCQLNFKTSTQVLTNQSQIQTKMQQETKSHPKHMVQVSTAWKMTKHGVISGPYFPAFGLNTERYFVSLRIQSACGEIRTRNNSTFGHLSRSERQLQHQQKL